MEEKIVIESKRLYVRPWQESDWEAFHQVMSDPQVHRYTSEEPWTVEKTKSVMAWFRRHRWGWEWEPGYFNCPLILRSTGQLIGRVGLNPYLEDERIPEIEWTIGREHWRKGYATEIGRAILRYGFEEAGFAQILGFANPENSRSIRVMEKIDMKLIGQKEFIRGHNSNFYKITKEDYDCLTGKQK